MNLNSLLSISRSGLNGLQKNLDNVAHNIANVNTVGYKEQQTSFQDLLKNQTSEQEVLMNKNPESFLFSAGLKVADSKTNFVQGSLGNTGRMLDLSIEGTGFFGVRGQDNTLYLTRAGDFHLDANKQLVNGQGDLVEMTAYVPSQQWPTDIQIDGSGNITALQNNQTITLGKLSLFAPENPEALQSVGNNLYIADGTAVLSSLNGGAGWGVIHQSALENSTVELATSMTDLITTQRAYSLNTKALQTTDELMQSANRLAD